MDVPGAALAAKGTVAVAMDNGDALQDRDVALQHGGGYGKEGERHERLALVEELAGYPRWA